MKAGLLLFFLFIFCGAAYCQQCEAPTVPGVTVCPGTSAILTATAPGGTYQWYDAVSGGTLLATGTSYTTPVLTENTNYYVQTTIGTCTSLRTVVTVNVRASPSVSPATICAGNAASLTATGPGGIYQWYDAASEGNLLQNGASYTTPALTATTTYFVQTTVDNCTTPRTAVTVTVNPNTAPPTASGATICSGFSVTLSATAPGGTYQWFATPTGGTPLISSPDYTTPTLNATTTYYVQTTTNGCTSSRTAVTVTVNDFPPGPTVPGTTICAGSSATLTASGGGTYQWFAVPFRGNPISTENTFTTPILTRTTTYYVDNSMNGCTSLRTPVTVTVNQIPEPPAVPGIRICAGATATLTPISPGGTYAWYDAAENGNLLTTNSSFTSPVLNATTIYYVQTTVNNCTSPRTAVTVTVSDPLPAPQVSDTSVCSGGTVTLTATGAGDMFEWYDAPSGGNRLLTNPQYTTPPLSATTIYYVQTSLNNCISTRTRVTVTVNPVPDAPSVSGTTTICPGTTATLTAAAAGGGTYQWFDAVTGGNIFGTGSPFTTPILTRNTILYVQTTVNGCVSTRTRVPISMTNVVDPGFLYLSGTYCQSGNDPTPQIYSPNGGTFSASPNGLVFISNTTGQIDLSASTLGTYVITFVSNGPCPSTTTAPFTLTETANASFSYAGPYCQGSTPNAPAAFIAGASAGSFTSSPAGLIIGSDGTINLRESLPGTYTVTNTIPASGLCPGTSSSTSVIINPGPSVNAGPDQAAPFGSPIRLSGSTTAPTYRWSGGLGTFSDPAILNPVYTHAANETLATLYLTTTGPGSCTSQTDSVVITLSPAAPRVSGATICAGATAILTASPSNGMYEWYDAVSGGNLLLTNPTYVTPPLTANTTYYVQRVIAGSASSRTPVTVTVTSIPPAPVAAGTTICAGNPVALTATAPGGTYQWYNVPSGGNLLATGSSFTTPALTTTTTYYVETSVDGCTSPRTAVTVTVNAVPLVTSAALATICNRNRLNYIITADIPGTTFTWSRAALPDLTNAAVTNQTSSTINETLITTATVPVDVTYVITPMYNSCTGPSLNFVVTVDPTPAVTSALAEAICNNSASNYTITFNMSGTGFSWSREAVTGISNAPVSGQRSATIREVLTNTTNRPVDVTYVFNSSYNGCEAPPFNYVVTVNPAPTITSASSYSICSGTENNYVITSDMSNAVFTWSRDAIPNISNPAVSDRASAIISETLINTGNSPIDVLYRIKASSNGCAGLNFIYRVTVNPLPATPVIISNSPVCINSTLSLSTTQILNASYLWAGPNGFRSTQQNPVISGVTQANSGQYSLIITANGCTSSEATAIVSVNELPLANAGINQTVCVQTQGITLSGSVAGGTLTGIWSSSGTGTFSPSNTSLTGTYAPSAADRNAGSVILTLTSTSRDDCTPAVSSVTITFEELPIVQAGTDQDVCSQNPAVVLNGSVTVAPGAVWSSSGTGTFSPSNSSLTATYIPGNADIARGNVVLTLSATGTNVCLPVTDQLIINIIPPPVIVMEPDRFVPLNRSIQLNPTVNEPDVQYLWTPNTNLNDNTVRNPVVTGVTDQTYTLRVTDSRGCFTEEEIFIDVLMPVAIPNTFTPNGDGINDVWNIAELPTYPENTVNIYNRYGVKIFTSLGYIQSWDGTYNGEPAPVGTYYYIINTQFPGMVYSGSITVLR